MTMRFGQGLIQSLINPNYGEGLFSLGQTVGSTAAGTPRALAQANARRRQGQQGLMAVLNSGDVSDPNVMQSAQAIISQTGMDPTQGQQMIDRARVQNRADRGLAMSEDRAAREQRNIAVSAKLAAIKTRMTSVWNNNKLSTEQQQETIQQLQAEAMKAAQGTSLANAAASLAQETQMNSLRVEKAQFEERVRDDRWEMYKDNFRMSQDQFEWSKAKAEEWEANGHYRDMQRQAAESQQRVAILSNDASSLSKEAYFAKHRNTDGSEKIWDAIQDEQAIRKAQVEEARLASKRNEFAFTDSDLESMGYSANEIKALKAIKPSQANAAVAKKLLAAPELPLVGYTNIYESAALGLVSREMNLDLDDDEERREAQSIASNLALKAADAHANAPNSEDKIQAGLDSFAITLEKHKNPDKEESSDGFAKTLDRIAKELSL